MDENWLDEYSVARPSKVGSLAIEFERALDTSAREENIQAFIASNRFILSEQLSHCHHVVPKFRLGAQYVTDFLLADITSSGTFWVFVEIEPANLPLTTRTGFFSGGVRVGIQQLRDWRDWLRSNNEYAQRHGLNNCAGYRFWLIVGRRARINNRFNQLR